MPITNEGCLKKIPNRFLLCILAAKRAKSIRSGAKSNLAILGRKATITALKEIENGEIREATEEESELIKAKREAKQTKNKTDKMLEGLMPKTEQVEQ